MVPEGEVELRYEFEPTGKPDPAQGIRVPARGAAVHQPQAGCQHRHAVLNPGSVWDAGRERAAMTAATRRAGGVQRCVPFTGIINE